MSRFFLIGGYLLSVLEAANAARVVSAAVAARRTPSDAALKILGIDPERFRTIRYV